MMSYLLKGAPVPIYATVGDATDHAFIGNWTHSHDFSAYFASCAPAQCTYFLTVTPSFAATFSVVLGLLGGLNVSLRILIQSATRVILWVASRRQRSISKFTGSANDEVALTAIPASANVVPETPTAVDEKPV